MKDKFVEMSPELAEALDAAARRADELRDQLVDAENAEQRLLDDAVASITEFKVGDDVMQSGTRYRVERVRGEAFRYAEMQPKVILSYYGSRVKKDGSTFGRRQRLYDPKPISG